MSSDPFMDPSCRPGQFAPYWIRVAVKRGRERALSVMFLPRSCG